MTDAKPLAMDGNTFLEFIEKGDKTLSEMYLLSYPDVIHVTNMKQETPLHIAATYKYRDDPTMLRLLLGHKPNVNAKNLWGQTPLHYAAETSSVEMIKELLKYPEIDVNIRDVNGYSVLHSYVNSRRPCSLSGNEKWKSGFLTLIEAGVCVNCKTNFGHSIVHFASISLSSELSKEPTFLQCIYENCRDIQLDATNNYGQTFLHSYLTTSHKDPFCDVLANHNEEELEALLNQPDCRGITPWLEYLSSKNVNREQIEKLIRFGASLKVTDNLGNTVLHHARQFGTSERNDVDIDDPAAYSSLGGKDAGFKVLVEIPDVESRKALVPNHSREYHPLLHHGADVNASNIYGISAASAGGVNPKELRKLNSVKTKKVSFKETDRWNRTPLFIMLNTEQVWRTHDSDEQFIKCFVKVVKKLSKKPKLFDINHQDKFGSTLLHLAAYHDDELAVRILLDFGANPDIFDHEMDTPIDTALNFGNFGSYNVFIEHNRVATTSAKYAKFYELPDVVHLSQIPDLDSLNSVIRSIPEETDKFAEQLLSKHHINFHNKKGEAYKVTKAVNELVHSISAKVGDYDERFRISVFRSGSSSEGTKVGRPDEFDFVLCLEALMEKCDVEMSTDPECETYARIKFKDEQISDEFRPFFDEENYLMSTPYLNLLFRYILRALYQTHLWENGQLLFLGNKEALAFKAPVINLSVYWVGSMYKHLKISVDLVPAVQQHGWWPAGWLPETITETIRNEGCFVLLQSKVKNLKLDHSVMQDSIAETFLPDCNHHMLLKRDDRNFRISVARGEIAIMKSLPDNFRQAYALAKMMRSNRLTPMLMLDKSFIYQSVSVDASGHMIDPSTLIKSYYLKNCLFYLADSQYEELKDATPFTITVQVYRKLFEFASAAVFQPFLQRSTNLFKYQNVCVVHSSTLIDLDKLRFEFLCRKLSIEMVQHVLGCPTDTTDCVSWLQRCGES